MTKDILSTYKTDSIRTDLIVGTDRSSLYFVNSEDVAPHLEYNKNLQTHSDGYTQDKSMRLEAHIPDVIVLLWRDTYGVDVFNKDHWPRVQRLLNDPEWQHLRTNNSTLGMKCR